MIKTIPAGRMQLSRLAPRPYAAMIRLEASIEFAQHLRELVKLRASQMNGCAFCIDMHWKDARAAGESEARLYGLDAWRESLLYSERERAALALCEAMSRWPTGMCLTRYGSGPAQPSRNPSSVSWCSRSRRSTRGTDS